MEEISGALQPQATALGVVFQRVPHGFFRPAGGFRQLPGLGVAVCHQLLQFRKGQVVLVVPAVGPVLVLGHQLEGTVHRVGGPGGAVAHLMGQRGGVVRHGLELVEVQKNAVAAVHFQRGGVCKADGIGNQGHAQPAHVLINGCQ